MIVVGRAVPTLMWAIILVAIFSFGPFAGSLALVKSTIGFAEKLMAEQVEATLALLPGRVHMFPYRLIGAETFRRYFADPFAIVSRKRGRCLALGEEISFEPDGSIVACPDFPDADLGHITEAPWPHPWKTDKMARLREAYRSVDFGICARCCRFF